MTQLRNEVDKSKGVFGYQWRPAEGGVPRVGGRVCEVAEVGRFQKKPLVQMISTSEKAGAWKIENMGC